MSFTTFKRSSTVLKQCQYLLPQSLLPASGAGCTSSAVAACLCSSRPELTLSRSTLLRSVASNGVKTFTSTTPSLNTAEEDEEKLAKIKEDVERDQKRRREKTRRWAKYGLLLFFPISAAGAGLAISILGQPDLDMEGQALLDEFSEQAFPIGHAKRAWKYVRTQKETIEEPIRPLLLPDPLKPPYIQPKYTLCLEIKDVLVHPEWTYAHGWRFKKRPGVDFLLTHCAPPLFEIVIFTSENALTMFPVVDNLDPNGYIFYRLFRDSTRYLDRVHVKDLAGLNRDLSKVIFVDFDANAVKFHRENAFILPRWDGNMQDKSLYDLAYFLKTMATTNVHDVRHILKTYVTEEDPIKAYRERQIELQTVQQMKQHEASTRQSANLLGSWSRSVTGKR